MMDLKMTGRVRCSLLTQRESAMRRIRFSIASLLGAVLSVAMALAALREADDLWDSSVFCLTLGLLLLCVSHRIHHDTRVSSSWIWGH
jgi:hypothetical protein